MGKDNGNADAHVLFTLVLVAVTGLAFLWWLGLGRLVVRLPQDISRIARGSASAGPALQESPKDLFPVFAESVRKQDDTFNLEDQFALIKQVHLFFRNVVSSTRDAWVLGSEKEAGIDVLVFRSAVLVIT